VLTVPYLGDFILQDLQCIVDGESPFARVCYLYIIVNHKNSERTLSTRLALSSTLFKMKQSKFQESYIWAKKGYFVNNLYELSL